MAENLTLQDLANLITKCHNDVLLVKTSLETKIVDLDNKLTLDYKHLKGAYDRLETRQLEVEKRCDKLERLMLLTDLVVYGVPYIKDEKLEVIFGLICSAIDFNYTPGDIAVQSYFRPKKTSESPIIVKFITNAARNEFFFLYLKKKSLCLEDINFESKKRVHIKESLTKSNSSIFKTALAAKAQDLIQGCFTRSGLVFVKLNKNSNGTQIYTMDQLLSLLPASFAVKQINNGQNKRKPSTSPVAESTPTKNTRNVKRLNTNIGDSSCSNFVGFPADMDCTITGPST